MFEKEGGKNQTIVIGHAKLHLKFLVIGVKNVSDTFFFMSDSIFFLSQYLSHIFGSFSPTCPQVFPFIFVSLRYILQFQFSTPQIVFLDKQVFSFTSSFFFCIRLIEAYTVHVSHKHLLFNPFSSSSFEDLSSFINVM